MPTNTVPSTNSQASVPNDSPSTQPIRRRLSSTKRSFEFVIEEHYAPLVASIPDHTAIYNKWPRKELRTQLPNYLPIAVMTAEESSSSISNGEDDSTPYILMGKPIHVVAGDELEINLVNNLQATGLSLHFHGFEMADAIEYDGVVGLTQCAVSPKHQFKYSFKVEEEEGTYWYHTHSGNLGVESHNVIKGPLIVHPNTIESHALVDMLHTGTNLDSSNQAHGYKPLLSYNNERILFFSDGFLQSDSALEMYTLGGLFPPPPYNDDGFIAAAMEYQFGTLNGKLREIIHVVRGETYKFRLLNGGSHFPYRVSIDNFDMTIVGADSSPVEPFLAEELILHNGERFDVEITIPHDDSLKAGDTFWIRADTLESRKQGYENGIRAILHVVDDMMDVAGLNEDDIRDPDIDIIRGMAPAEDLVTMNCYSQMETMKASNTGKGACLPITSLTNIRGGNVKENYHDSENTPLLPMVQSNIRTVDFDLSFAPMHAFFARVEHGDWKQFVGSSTNMLQPDFDPDRDLHPNTAVMNVPAFSSVIIIWRSRSAMDHPMHLHGYKMEILEVFAANRERDCNLAKCNLPGIFNSTRKVEELESIPVGSRPLKDTFIIPSGGAVATRIFTRDPAPYFAHCHMEVHREDGMAFILNVGDYRPPKDGSWLPPDFPDCNTKFLDSKHEEPHCDCFIDEDAVLGTTLDPTYKCSRKYLCFHEQSQAAAVAPNSTLGGFKMQSSYEMSGRAISGIFVGIIALGTIFFTKILPRLLKSSSSNNEVTAESCSYHASSSSDQKLSFCDQVKVLSVSHWAEYRDTAINVLRVVEVAGLGILTGSLFEDVGNNDTATGFGEKTSLLFFSTTLWSQTRMYPAIQSYFKWAHSDCHVMHRRKHFGLLPICLSRMIVVNGCESWWPFLFVFCAYPLASMFGNIFTVTMIGIFLALNNICYIALGAVFATVMPTVSLAMIGATLFAQTTVVCAGFFTKLPVAVGWIRYISPIFYTFKGIVKLTYKWDDTYRCAKGQSAVGPNDCFLEESAAIDDYKQRGINVATFGDPSSSRVDKEILFLVLLFAVYQVLIILYQLWALSKRDVDIDVDDEEEETEVGSSDEDKMDKTGRTVVAHCSDDPDEIDEDDEEDIV